MRKSKKNINKYTSENLGGEKMENILNYLNDYIGNHVAFLLFLCLGLGFIVGKLKIKSFSLGATVGTLLVGILLSQIASVEIPSTIKTVFFSLFCFTIGFEVGPAFFTGLRSSGIKLVGLSVFFTAVSVIAAFVICRISGLDVGYGIGLLGGALTQSSVTGAAQLEGDVAGHVATAFGLTYIFGTLGVVLFVKNIAPLILRKSLKTIVKEKVDSISAVTPQEEQNAINRILQVRAFVLTENSRYCGCTIEQVEDDFGGRIEIEAVYRGEDIVPDMQEQTLLIGDVIQVVGDISILDAADRDGLAEVSDPKYFRVELVDAKIVLTEDFSETGAEILSNYGILVKPSSRKKPFHRGSIISVKGSAKAIKKAAKKMGYIKDEGNVTDIAYLSIATAVGLLLGSLTLRWEHLSFSLGDCVGTLLAGLLCGWWYQKKPRVGRIPSATRIFLKNLGLNFYIAALSLEVGERFFASFGENGLKLILLGAILTLVPHLVSLLFGKYVMKIDDADLLGGLCGCGTCTAALNGLSDETNSSVFALGYAPGCAAGNIFLTIAGMILAMII